MKNKIIIATSIIFLVIGVLIGIGFSKIGIFDNNFYKVAIRGAWHKEDNSEKARFKNDRGTVPVYRHISTPPNLLYIDLPEKNTFITDDMGMTVLEVDRFGNVVWEQKQEGKTYFGVTPINNEEIVFNAYSYQRVEKINKITGEAKVIYQGAMRDIVNTSDGNLLMVGHEDKGKAIVMDLNGNVLWESNPEFYYPRGVWQKEDGNILVVDFQDKAFEIDYKTKEIVWEMDGFNFPNSIQEMSNKNYLIADEHNNRIIEVNPISKEIVRSYNDELWSPNYARELENGDWLISDSDNHRVIQINSQNNIVWELSNMHSPNRAVRAE